MAVFSAPFFMGINWMGCALGKASTCYWRRSKKDGKKDVKKDDKKAVSKGSDGRNAKVKRLA